MSTPESPATGALDTMTFSSAVDCVGNLFEEFRDGREGDNKYVVTLNSEEFQTLREVRHALRVARSESIHGAKAAPSLPEGPDPEKGRDLDGSAKGLTDAARPGEDFLSLPWVVEDFKHLHALHPYPTPEHDVLVRLFMGIKNLSVAKPARAQGEPATKLGPGIVLSATGRVVRYCICEEKDGDNAQCPIHHPSEAKPAEPREAEPPCKRCGGTTSIGHSRGWDGEAYEIPCPDCCPFTEDGKKVASPAPGSAEQSPSSVGEAMKKALRYLDAIFSKRKDSDPMVIEFSADNYNETEQGFTKWAAGKARSALAEAGRDGGERG